MGQSRRTGHTPPREQRARGKKPRARKAATKPAPAAADPVAKRKPPAKKRKPREAVAGLREIAAQTVAEDTDFRPGAPDPQPVVSAPHPLDAAADAIIAALQAHAAAMPALPVSVRTELGEPFHAVPLALGPPPIAPLPSEHVDDRLHCDDILTLDSQGAPPRPPYAPHDVFDIAAGQAEDPPFDAPVGNDPQSYDDHCSVELPPSPAPPPPLNALTRTPSPTRLTRAPDNEYLARARSAVRARVEVERHTSTLKRLQRSKIGASIAAGLALPLVLSLSWRLTEPRDTTPAPAAAAAAPMTSPLASAAQLADEFQAATRMLESGQTRRGAAAVRRLAAGGYAPAQFRLAKMHEHGAGATRDLTLARQWAERAARAGNVRAMHDVGVYYAQGEGATRNEALAFRWFREAASFGIADSQHNLAILYEQGRGVAANPMEGLFWYLVAARHGDPSAADRAVALATQIAPAGVEQARARARAFQARAPNAAANGA